MSDESLDDLGRTTARRAPAELRRRVLTTVERELNRSARRRREGAIELAVAASLLVGIGWNAWLWHAEDAWQARVYGPTVVPAEIKETAEMVAAASDRDTGEYVLAQWSKAWRVGEQATTPRSETYERLFDELTTNRDGAKL